MANNTSRCGGDNGWNRQGDQRRGGRRREWERGGNDSERSGYDYSEGYGHGYGTYNGDDYNRDYGYSTGEGSGYNTYGGAYGSADRDRGGQQRGRYHGRGPQGYQRSDERIQDDVSDRLTWHGDVDATHITVTVSGGEVTLEGRVAERRQKRIAEDVAESVNGVKDVHNRIKVDQTLNDQGG